MEGRIQANLNCFDPDIRRIAQPPALAILIVILIVTHKSCQLIRVHDWMMSLNPVRVKTLSHQKLKTVQSHLKSGLIRIVNHHCDSRKVTTDNVRIRNVKNGTMLNTELKQVPISDSILHLKLEPIKIRTLAQTVLYITKKFIYKMVQTSSV